MSLLQEGSQITQRTIEVDLSQQRLLLREGDTILLDTLISAAKNGAGEINGSECTPRGRHVIHEKIGVR